MSVVTAERAPLRPLRPLLTGLLTGLIFAASGGVTSADDPQLHLERRAGEDRVATAAAVAQAFEPGVARVYVVSAAGFADALSAGPTAAVFDAPILLTWPEALPATTIDELVRLQPREIVVVGGLAAVPEHIREQLRFYTPGLVRRIAGSDRYATAASVSYEHFPAGLGGPVFVATGEDWPDGLAGGAVAAYHGVPLLLASAHWLPDSTRKELLRLRPSRIVVVGGPASVAPTVRQELSLYTDGAVQWFHGESRYDTAARISQTTFPRGTKTVFIATGENFPDVLTGVPVAARERAPLLLLPAVGVPPQVARELERLAPENLVILGGSAAVAKASESYIVELLTLAPAGPDSPPSR